jgi:hypothetical protein
MTRGARDYFGLREKVEVAFRPSLVWTTGRVMYYDPVDSPTKRWTDWSDSPGTAALTTANAYVGSASILLSTTANPAGYGAVAWKFGLPPTGKIGMALEFAPADNNFDNIGFYIYKYDGTYYHFFDVYYTPSDNKWRVFERDGSLTEIPGGTQSLDFSTNCWHHFKIIIDLITEKYVRFYSDDLTLDLSAYQSYRSANATEPRAEAAVFFNSDGANASSCNVDNIVFTEES